MNKVKLKKEIYKALDKAIYERGKVWVLNEHYRKHYRFSKWVRRDFLPLNNVNLETMCNCIVNGYELDSE